MPKSIFQAIGLVCVIVATTAAVPLRPGDAGTLPPPQAAGNSARTSAERGLPADFPHARGLSACRPIVTGGEIICEWHGVDGHAIYTFYHDALPRAGYTILPGAQESTSPHYIGVIGFSKGTATGAVSIAGDNLTIQYLPHE